MRTRSPAVVGREAELRALCEALREARAGRGGAVFLVGEPGIGKTRLAATVTGAAFAAGMHALSGRGSTIGPMVPFRPLTEALMSLVRGRELRGAGLPGAHPSGAQLSGTGSPGTEFPGTDELGPYRRVLARLAPELGPRDDQPGGASLVLLAEAVLRLLAIAGRQRGCLLVLDDLQDADAETLAVVEYLVDNVAALPVMVLATVRLEAGDALDLVRSASQRRAASMLQVQRLTRDEVCAMVAACLDAPPSEVPAEVLDQVWIDSAGNPFVVEELVQGLVDGGLLIPVVGGWQLIGAPRAAVPAAVVRSVASRIDRLGQQVRELLCVAAVLGNRFSLSVVRQVTGSDDRSIVTNLHAGVAAQLVVADEPAPDWYAFRHPLTAEALLASLTSLERTELSRRAADGVQVLYPDLAGDWCPLLASLRLAAGDTERAGHLFAEAGRRALHRGAPDSAITLLERASELLAGHADVGARADCLEWLLLALGETGRFDRALELVRTLDELGDRGLSRTRRAALHAKLAEVANVAGRWAEGMAQVHAARNLLGAHASDEDRAPVDAVAASLTLSLPSPDRLQVAAKLASRAGAAAERAGLPTVACEAWQLLGMITRERDLAKADTYFVRSLRLAERHQLPFKRITALTWLAGTACLLDGSVTDLVRARREVLRAGAITAAYSIDGVLGLQAVLRAEYSAAADILDECLASAARLRLCRVAHYVLVAKAVLAAHQGRRREMSDALGEFRNWGGGESPELPLEFGLARTFCALLEEERELAERELAQAMAYEAENPTGFHLAGRYGLNLLLGVLSRRVGWAHYQETVSSPASSMRWNSQFVHLARAVLLGRDGQPQASAAVAAARQAAATYPMAGHLGLRLVAEEAHKAGWGEPVQWLRAAESYFHEAGVQAVATACRAALRRAGAPIQQRRPGVDQVPAALRTRGVTAREYEVFRLLAERMGNKAIGSRLCISPRTVEKHVANLMAKTDLADREQLATYARRVLIA